MFRIVKHLVLVRHQCISVVEWLTIQDWSSLRTGCCFKTFFYHKNTVTLLKLLLFLLFFENPQIKNMDARGSKYQTNRNKDQILIPASDFNSAGELDWVVWFNNTHNLSLSSAPPRIADIIVDSKPISRHRDSKNKVRGRGPPSDFFLETKKKWGRG